MISYLDGQHLILDNIKAIDTFVDHTNVPQNVIVGRGNIKTANTVIYVTQTLIGDSFIVCYNTFFSLTKSRNKHYSGVSPLHRVGQKLVDSVLSCSSGNICWWLVFY